MFDFGTVLDAVAKQESGIKVQIKDLTGQLTDWWVTIAGVDSKRARDARNAASDRRIAQQRLDAPTSAEQDELTSEVLAACIIGWEGATLKGAPFEYSVENARIVASNPYISGQLAAAAANRALFIQG